MGALLKLTKANLHCLILPRGKTDHLAWDDEPPGLGAGVSRTWIVCYRGGRRQRVVKLGRLEVLDPDQARKLARETLARRELGAGLQAERRLERARAAVTLGGATALYLERHVTPRLWSRSASEVRRCFVKHWAPLYRLPIDEVGRRQVTARLAELASASGPVAANRSRSLLAALFS